ncbi:ArsR family transcriptional regulator [Pseudothermotoga hypogea DSM 11164 = NBRC 106472]|uniref:ArsR family transcriptional regulator n=2 Tax=Pseudothermotoga hypogea TaxID=57487 RepID=A0A0X1KT24_9THEM|nr:ArsR family transcriptional regulator [Pseudothermotoga hypogea DSM 11164 = NBRC 106472]
MEGPSTHTKLNPISMKRENKKLILRYLIERGQSSRMEIVRHTKLAQSAIWRIMNELVNEGLVQERGFTTGKRRKPVIYGPTRSFITSVVYNVEVLETLVAIGFLDGSWKVIERFPTPPNFELFKESVKMSFEKIIKEKTIRKDITKIVFSLPGMVNYEKKLLIFAPNLSWKNIDFQQEFVDLNMEVFVENDANLSLMAEQFFSQDVKRSKVAFFLYFGEGIGGAISVDGSIVRGKNSAAGEIGHVTFNGDKNEIESFLSISRLIDKVQKWIGNNDSPLEEKFQRLKRLWFIGQRDVKKILEDYLHHVAVVLRDLVYFLNPDVIILGGLINDIYETFGPYIRRELETITEKEILTGVVIRDSIFKEVPPSLVGGNVLVIENVLKTL